MKRLLTILFSLLSVLILFSCKSEGEPQKEQEARALSVDAPQWFLVPPQAKDAIYGIGVATSSDLSRARDMASSRARADIAKQLSISVETMLTDYFQEAGTGDDSQAIEMIESITKEVADVDLRGAKTIEAYVADDGKVYILAEYSMNQFIEEQVAEVFQRNESAAFAEFKAQQALDRLAAEVGSNPPRSDANENE